jgi:DNA-binding GntR family transcriptional regulator
MAAYDSVREVVDLEWRSPAEIAALASVSASAARDALVRMRRDRLVERQQIGNAIFYRLRR